jgi:hypothetical protein
MPFVVWIVLGLVAGFIASKVFNKAGEGMILDIGWDRAVLWFDFSQQVYRL